MTSNNLIKKCGNCLHFNEPYSRCTFYSIPTEEGNIECSEFKFKLQNKYYIDRVARTVTLYSNRMDFDEFKQLSDEIISKIIKSHRG